MQDYSPYETYSGGFEVRTAIALTVTIWISSFMAISEHQRRRLHNLYAATDECVTISCKLGAECFHRFFVSVSTVWLVAGIIQMGEIDSLAEVSVKE